MTGTSLRFIPACILTSRCPTSWTFWASPRQSSSELDSALGSHQNWDLRLSCFTRHFGRRLGITNNFVLLSACSKIGLRGHAWADGMVTLLRSSKRKRRFITGVETPACILPSLRDYFRTSVLCRDSALWATSLPVF